MKRRSSLEVAERIVGLIACINKVFQPEETIKWVEDNKIEKILSPLELEFIKDNNPTEEARINFSWRIEALASLLWSINAIEAMPGLNAQFNMDENGIVKQIVEDTENFLANATIRDEDELIEMEEYLYHQHWRVVDQQLGFNVGEALPSLYKDEPDISELNPGIVYERRYGMSWVVGKGDSWDDVPTDT